MFILSCASEPQKPEVTITPINLKIEPKTAEKLVGENISIKIKSNKALNSCVFQTEPLFSDNIECKIDESGRQGKVTIINLRETFTYWFIVDYEEILRDDTKQLKSETSEKGTINVLKNTAFDLGKRLGIAYKTRRLKDFEITLSIREYLLKDSSDKSKASFINGFTAGYSLASEKEADFDKTKEMYSSKSVSQKLLNQNDSEPNTSSITKKSNTVILTYAKIFLNAAQSPEYNHGEEIGRNFANKDLSEVQAYNIVQKSLMNTRSDKLAFKTGFIEGFNNAISNDDQVENANPGFATYNALFR
jgi:hypothetical protein